MSPHPSDEPASILLREELEMLGMALDDFRTQVDLRNAADLMRRILAPLSREPMAGFLKSVLPELTFDAWWTPLSGGGTAMSGARSLPWPDDVSERVALQMDLCRAMASGEMLVANVLTSYFRERGTPSIPSMLSTLVSRLLQPMVRDIEWLTRRRALPRTVVEALHARPSSQDAQLDRMFADACALFASPSSADRQHALEQLWDAWELAKTRYGEPSASAKKLLDDATAVPALRDVIEADAKALNHAGNAFFIRHKSTTQSVLTRPEETDYLFMRLHTLLTFALSGVPAAES